MMRKRWQGASDDEDARCTELTACRAKLEEAKALCDVYRHPYAEHRMTELGHFGLIEQCRERRAKLDE